MNKFRLFMMAAAVVFLAGCNVKKGKSQAVVDDVEVVADSTVYGGWGEGTSMHSLELITDAGDTITYTILDAEADLDGGLSSGPVTTVVGGMMSGDKMAVTGHKVEGEMLADRVIIGSCLAIDSFGPFPQRCQMVVFGLCTMVIECTMLDYVMSVQRQSVQFFIFSHKYNEIASAITKKTDHTLTILDGHGWYTGNEMKVLCILAKKNESVTIFRIVKIIDPNAFVSQSSVIGVYGEGFDEMKVKIKEKDIKKIK